MYATTKTFLDYFNLKTLDQLPALAEIRDFDTLTAELGFTDVVDETNTEAGNDGEPAVDTPPQGDSDVEAEPGFAPGMEAAQAEDDNPLSVVGGTDHIVPNEAPAAEEHVDVDDPEKSEDTGV